VLATDSYAPEKLRCKHFQDFSAVADIKVCDSQRWTRWRGLGRQAIDAAAVRASAVVAGSRGDGLVAPER
jgi:hypothetical protein